MGLVARKGPLVQGLLKRRCSVILSCDSGLLRKEEVCPVRMGDPRPENSVLSGFPNGRIFSWRQEGSVKRGFEKKVKFTEENTIPMKGRSKFLG